MKKMLRMTTVALVVGALSVSAQAALVGCKTTKGIKACVDVTNRHYLGSNLVMDVQGVASASQLASFSTRYVQDKRGNKFGFLNDFATSKTVKSGKARNVDANVNYRSVTLCDGNKQKFNGFAYSNYAR